MDDLLLWCIITLRLFVITRLYFSVSFSTGLHLGEKMAPKQQHMLLFYSAMTHEHQLFTQQTVAPFEATFFPFFLSS